MRMYLFIFSFFIIGCNSDSTEYPIPKEHQLYEHIKTGEKIQILGVGNGKELREKAETMDVMMNRRILRPNQSYSPEIVYDPDNADEKCICYVKILREEEKFRWYIITIEEIALNYKLVQIDSLKINSK